MLNKFKKTIHNRYSRFFEFVFYVRYLLIIFLISIAIFLIIPIFFNYEKKVEIVKSHLLENYNFEIKNYKRIKYNIFPSPNLELSNVQIIFKSYPENLNIKNIKIYPNFLNIYDYKNFNSNKIILKEGDLKFKISNFNFFAKQLFHQKNRLSFDNLNLKIIDEKIPVLILNNIKYTNFGYKENLIRGKIFGKNFKVELDNNNKNINFRLLKSGINVDINFDKNQKKNSKLGNFKTKILNTNFKSNFEYDGKSLTVFNSYFRSKNLSFKSDSKITLKPYFDINSKFIIEELNTSALKKLDATKLLKLKDFLRRINSRSEIFFKSQKMNNKFFNDLNLKVNLAYGRMNYSKSLSNTNSISQCKGSINFLEEYPLLFFNCYIKVKNKREFFKKFSIKLKDKNEKFELKFKGNLSFLNKKINFENILMDDNYKASKEDLKYFKETFENIIFDKNFIEIFDEKKIKEFIIEIS